MAAQLFYALWYAACALGVLAAYRIWQQGLSARYRALWIYITVATVKSGVLLSARYNPTLQRSIESGTAPLMLALQALAIIGIFRSLTRSYPKFQVHGSIFLGLWAMFGFGAMLGVRYLDGPGDAVIFLERNAMLVMAIALVASSFTLPRSGRFPVPRSADRAALILAGHIAVCVASKMLYLTWWRVHPIFVVYVPVASNAVTWMLFALLLTRESDVVGEPIPIGHSEFKALREKLIRLDSQIALKEAMKAAEAEMSGAKPRR